MLPNVFKTGKQIDFQKVMKAYIVKNYDALSYNSDVQNFINEFQQNRNVLINLNDKEKTSDTLKSYKGIIVQYLSMLNIIKSKMNFGKDNLSIKIEFTWKDVLKNDNISSYNVNYEYYSVFFNLAVCYYTMGLATPINDEELKLKESIKNFQYAAWIFDNIKNEISNAIPPKDIPSDMTPNYLTYCSYLCLTQAQIYLFTVAERKQSSTELQSQLAKGIFDLITSAYNLAVDSLKKTINEETKFYLNIKRFWYAAISFTKMKDKVLEEFNKSGEGYGKAIAYLGLAVESINAVYKDLKKAKNLIDPKEFEAFKTSLETLGQEMLDKNERIYLSNIPEMAALPKPEKKIMVSQQNIPDNLNSLLESQNTSLDALVPKEVKKMMENYKQQMNDFIVENLNKYEHETDIDAYLAKLELPHSLECVLSQAEISESLWKKISDIQQKGGALFLDNHLSNLEKKNEELVKRTNDISIAINNEEEEDAKYRQQYGNRWTRTPSTQLNATFIQRIALILKNLSIAKDCDAKIRTSVVENRKYFEILSLPKQALGKQIPIKTDPDKIKNSEPALKLRKDLDTIESIKTKSAEVINKTFQTLNEDNIIPQFLQVLQNRTTEKAIFDENKKRYEELMKDLSAIDEEIKIAKISILANNTTFQRELQASSSYNEANDKFFRDIESHCSLYNQKLQQLQQGMKFYTDCNKEIQNLSEAVNDYLRSRDSEKINLINFIMSGGSSSNRNVPNVNKAVNNQFNDNNLIVDFTRLNTNPNQSNTSLPEKKYLNQSAFLDPTRNIVTNIGKKNEMSFGQSPNSNTNVNRNPNLNTNQNLNLNNQSNPNNFNYNQPNPNNFNYNQPNPTNFNFNYNQPNPNNFNYNQPNPNNFNYNQPNPNQIKPTDLFDQLNFINFNNPNQNVNNNNSYNDIYRNFNNPPKK